MAEKVIEIKRPEIYILLLFLAIILFLEIRVSISSPIAFGDEGFHTRMAQFMAENKEYPVDIPFEKTKLFSYVFSRPPLWNLSQAGFYLIFGFHDVIVKILNPLIAVIIGIVVFLIGRKLWNKEVGLISAIITITIPSFVTYSVLFYTDILFVFYFALFILTYFLALTNGEKKYLILSGVFAALTFLTKTPGVAVFLIIGLSFLYMIYRQKNILGNLKNHLILFALLLLVIFGYFLRNLIQYNTLSCDLPLFGKSGCSRTFNYESTYEYQAGAAGGTEESILRLGIMNYVNFAYGRVWFAFFGFLSGLILFSLRRELGDVLILLVLLSFIPIFYLGSGGRSEDAARYTLGFVPIVALIAGNFFERIYNFIKTYFKSVTTIIFIIVLAFVISQSSLNFKEKLFGYEKDGQIFYGMSEVKRFSSSFFEACEFVKESVPETALIFTVWDSQTAYNCQRSVVWGVPDIGEIVSSNDVKLATERLNAHGITHIFIQKFSINPRYYPTGFVSMLESNPDKFNKIYENGPIFGTSEFQQCVQTSGCDPGNIVYEVM